MTSHARHAMRMGWSEASPSAREELPLLVKEEAGRWGVERVKRGEEEAAGRYGGEEAIFSYPSLKII